MNAPVQAGTDPRSALASWLSGRRWWLAVWAVVAVSLLVGVSQGLLPRPLETHEVFVAQTSREMLARQDWIEPTFNFQPRLKKPPLMYWAVMVGAIATGNEVAMPPWLARLPSALAGAALVGLTIAIGVAVHGRAAGLLAGLLTVGMLGFARYTNNARPEMLYAACCALMLLGLVRAWRSADRSRAQTGWALLAWAGFGLAILAKGPHMPALMMGGFALFMFLEGERARALNVLRPMMGLGVMLLTAGPWVALIALRSAGEAGLWVDEMLDTGGGERHSILKWLQPYYLWAVPELVLPWAILLPLALMVLVRRHRESLRPARSLFWVAAITVLVMQLMPQRRGYYLLPINPALSVLMSVGFLAFAHGAARVRRIGWISFAIVLGALAFVIAIGVLSRESKPVLVACAAGAAILLLMMALIWRESRRSERSLLALLAVPGAAVVVASSAVGSSPALHPDSPVAFDRFADEIAALAGPEDTIAVHTGETGRLVYRLNRKIESLDSVEDIAAAAVKGPVWLVTPESRFEGIRAQVDAVIRASLDVSASDENPLVLVRCTPLAGGAEGSPQPSTIPP